MGVMIELIKWLVLSGLLCISVGFFCAVFPKKAIECENFFLKKLHLISAKKFNKPISPKEILATSIIGWLLLILTIGFFTGATLKFFEISKSIQVAFHAPGDSENSENGMSELNDSSTSLYAHYKSDIDAIIQPLIDTNKNVGISVGIICGDNNAVYGYGTTNLELDQRPDGDTIYEIGSVTKVFTSLLLANMAEEGEVDLTDPVQQFLPSAYKITLKDNAQMRLIDLASHTSGLPGGLSRGIDSTASLFEILMDGSTSSENPHRNFEPKNIYEYLSSGNMPEIQPGSKYGYSNLGMELLGCILSEEQNATYEDLIISRICQPLDMNDTKITLSPKQIERLAQGYRPDSFSIWSMCVRICAMNVDIHPSLSGAGAIRSTVNDMIKFLSANIDIDSTVLSKSIKTSHVIRHKIKSQRSIAMGWHIENPDSQDDSIMWHNGATFGYSSYVGFNIKKRIGVVILTNTASTVDAEGTRILEVLRKYNR